MTINERLFLLLAEAHRSQKDLADFIGVNERNIASWKQRGSDPPAKLIVKIAGLEKQIDRMMDLYQDEKIPVDVLSARIDKLHREKVALEEQLAAVEPPKPKRDYNEDAFAGLLADFSTVWNSAGLEDRRQIISALIRKITLDGESVNIEWAFLD